MFQNLIFRSYLKYIESYSSTSTNINVDPQMHYTNIDVRYSFIKSDKFETYGIVGFGWLFYYEEVNVDNVYYSGNLSDGQHKVGPNFGIGCSANLGKRFSLFAEMVYSYMPDDWDQLLASSGILIRVF